MIDSIKITLKGFSGNFDNCRETSKKVFEHPDKKEYGNYRLANKTKLDKHSLKVAHNYLACLRTWSVSAK